MTDEAIREGFANLKDQQDYQPLYLAGLSRAIGDWLLGMNATRLYTLKYGQNRQVLSIGRVQTPTLALIVNRQKEIEHFKPEPYWVLATVYRDTTFTATKGKFTSKEEGEKAFETIEGKPFTVTKVEKKEGKEQPPQLYDLTSLQVDCNRKYAYSAEMTLNLIQSLYEKKYTTYPRVISLGRYLPQMRTDAQRPLPDEIWWYGALCRADQAHRRQAPEEEQTRIRHLEGDRSPRHHSDGRDTTQPE